MHVIVLVDQDAGSNPAGITKYVVVAQLVEQWIENPRVGGSIPPRNTKFSMVARG